METNRQMNNMLQAAKERLHRRDPMQIAIKAGVKYVNGCFCLDTLGVSVHVSYSDCTVKPALPDWHLLSILHYLDLADGSPLKDRIMPFSQYADGMVRGGNFDAEAEKIVCERIGKFNEDELKSKCEKLGAKFIKTNADLCARFDFAPQYPVWLKIWFADEEFPASGRLFVDEQAAAYLTIEDAVTVGTLIMDALAHE